MLCAAKAGAHSWDRRDIGDGSLVPRMESCIWQRFIDADVSADAQVAKAGRVGPGPEGIEREAIIRLVNVAVDQVGKLLLSRDITGFEVGFEDRPGFYRGDGRC